MTVLIPLIVAVALGLAFVAYEHPGAYRVMFMFGFPVAHCIVNADHCIM